MIFAYDRYKKLKAPKIFLAKPSKEYIGILHTTLPNGKLRFNDISEMNFTIYSHIDGLPNLYYDQVNQMKLVEIQYVGWFHIALVDETEDGINSYKEVTVKSLECELNKKKVYDINGVFKLFDTNDSDNSLMHIVTNETNWSIGHIDNSLLTKSRTFSIDSDDIYPLLTSDISTSFGCIFQFDTYAKSISAYELSSLGNDTNIILSHRNLVLKNVISSDKDDIVTVFRVVGGDDLDIRAVNPTGSNKIINVDYFMTTECMSQELINALTIYKTKYNNSKSSYTTVLNQLKSLNNALSILNNKNPDVSAGESTTDWTKYGLVELNSQLSAQEGVQGTLTSAGASNISDSNYTQYLAVWNTIQAINTEIVVRKAQILSKKAEITTKETEILNINSTIDIETNFTTAQWTELQSFLMYEDDYSDTTYVVSETYSDTKVLEVKQELYDAASLELERVSKPQETIKIDSKNIFALTEHSNIQEDFSLGNFITVVYRDDLYTTLRLLELEIDFADITKLGLTFSNKNKLDSCTVQFAEIANLAKSTSNSISLNKLGYDEAANSTGQIQEFMNSNINATTNQVVSGQHKEVTFGEFGLRCKEWFEAQQKYDPHESWWNNNTLLFSDDNFKSSKTGIGLWDDGLGNKYYGFLGDVIVGKIFLGESLSIYNNSGTFTIKDDTGFQSTATVGTNIYNVGINPSNPASIFNISVNGSNKLYVDTTNNKLVMSGRIEATDGTLNNLTVTGTLSGGNIQGSNISGVNISGSSITAGTINGSTITGVSVSGSKITSVSGDYYTKIENGYISLGGSGESESKISSGLIRLISGTESMILTANSFKVDEIRANKILVGNYDVLTTNSTVSYATNALIAERHNSAHITTSHESNCFLTEFGTIYRVTSGSSKRFKHDISNEINPELDPNKLLGLNVVQFKYNNDFLKIEDDVETEDVIGIIAEDVAEKYPCAVEYDIETGQISNWNSRYLIPPMLKLIQDLYKEVEGLKMKL